MRLAPLIAALGAISILALPAASAERGTATNFSVNALQARGVSVTIQFIAAFNGRRSGDALNLLTPRISVSDCDYKNVRAVISTASTMASAAVRRPRSAHADQDLQ